MTSIELDMKVSASNDEHLVDNAIERRATISSLVFMPPPMPQILNMPAYLLDKQSDEDKAAYAKAKSDYEAALALTASNAILGCGNNPNISLSISVRNPDLLPFFYRDKKWKITLTPIEDSPA